jgi:hypothetical protein
MGRIPAQPGGVVDGTEVAWVCPDGEWRCSVGDHEDLTRPQRDVMRLAPILSRRAQRRGTFLRRAND